MVYRRYKAKKKEFFMVDSINNPLTLAEWGKAMLRQDFTDEEKKKIAEAKTEVDGRIDKFLEEIANG